MDYTVRDGTLWFNTWKACALIASMVYKFVRHVENFNLIQIIFAFYKDGSNLPKRTIWVKPYCPAIQIYQKHFKESEKSFLRNLIEETWENNIVRILLYPDQIIY